MSRRFQFSLRTLMLAAIVAAIPCAVVGSKINDKRRERAIVADLQSRGVLQIRYDRHSVRRGKPLSRWGYDWCRKLLGDDFFDTITFVGLKGDVSDEDLAKISEFQNLQEAIIQGFDSKQSVNDRVTDAGLAHLKKLRSLKSLMLFGTAATETAIADIERSLPDCQVVNHR